MYIHINYILKVLRHVSASSSDSLYLVPVKISEFLKSLKLQLNKSSRSLLYDKIYKIVTKRGYCCLVAESTIWTALCLCSLYAGELDCVTFYQNTRNANIRLSRLYTQPPNSNIHVLSTFYGFYHTTTMYCFC